MVEGLAADYLALATWAHNEAVVYLLAARREGWQRELRRSSRARTGWRWWTNVRLVARGANDQVRRRVRGMTERVHDTLAKNQTGGERERSTR